MQIGKVLNPIDKIMFSIDMFHEGTWGHEFHPEMIPDENTHVLNPHKGLSNFSSGDAVLQLRQYGITTLVLAGMSANLCVESHLRDAIENGFEGDCDCRCNSRGWSIFKGCSIDEL